MSAPSTGNKYRIETLEDVWNLPTSEMVGRCLREMAAAMQTMRATVDLLNEASRSLDAQEAFDGNRFEVKWPGFMEWTDDNGGESNVQLRFGEQQILSIGLKHSARPE